MYKNNKNNKVITFLCLLILVFVVISIAMFMRSENLSQKYSDAKAKLSNYKELERTGEFFVDGVKTHGSLSVKNTELLDQKGEKIQLRGVSSHGLLWYPEYTNYAAIKSTRSYGANAFRIAMYANDVNGSYKTDKEKSVKLLKGAVENVLAADMYAIVDFHVLNEENPLIDMDIAKEFFKNIAKSYGDNPGIIYEICNEPNGATSWEDIKEYSKAVIEIIRKYAPHSIIIVGTPDYSYSLSKAYTLNYENIMYSFHYYAGVHGGKEEYQNIINNAMDNNLAVFVTEWGIKTDNGDYERILNTGEEFVSYLNQEKISWFAWDLSNKDECFSILNKNTNTLSNFKEGDLTDVGKIVFKALDN
ncbi:endoglucanase [Acetitomaculum ruminis DSM 5522]|uniref:cellulase n=1 Tax=Acetitomaculum ruminis DSM 5522 TaxID=1120918 RepID=A0A1I0ZZJ4_9FIRM|nr:glycoside hydrolase family 5 protein [Acetitomaculum ruminis]SFB29820.1 endoglucanase [Acetitomaculum ruminis DSM 5522]